VHIYRCDLCSTELPVYQFTVRDARGQSSLDKHACTEHAVELFTGILKADISFDVIYVGKIVTQQGM
jgi:hypothetical protein